MSKYKDIKSFFEERGPEDIERFVDKNLNISQQIHALLEEKGWSQKDLAEALGKSSAEISKWLSGSHNLTLRSITKMEAVLDDDIILTPIKAEHRFKTVEYITFRVHAQLNQLMPNQQGYRESRTGQEYVDNQEHLQVA